MLTFRQDYWEDPAARRAFQAFLHTIHGLDLARWEAAGQWDPAYRPYSLFDEGGHVVSSLCVYTMELVVAGRRCRAAQISGVGTLTEYRRQGLNRQLTEWALEETSREHEFTFLFADEDARPFYERCGFLPVSEARPSVRVAGREPRPGLVRIDPSRAEDWQLVVEYASRRAPVSKYLGVLSPCLLLFHALYTLSDRLYHLPALDLLVAMQHEGGRLTLYDLIGERLPSLDRLYPFLAREDNREIAFQFVPDCLDPPDLEWSPLPPGESGLHDRGDLPLRGEAFLFPFTAHA